MWTQTQVLKSWICPLESERWFCCVRGYIVDHPPARTKASSSPAFLIFKRNFVQFIKTDPWAADPLPFPCAVEDALHLGTKGEFWLRRGFQSPNVKSEILRRRRFVSGCPGDLNVLTFSFFWRTLIFSCSSVPFFVDLFLFDNKGLVHSRTANRNQKSWEAQFTRSGWSSDLCFVKWKL